MATASFISRTLARYSLARFKVMCFTAVATFTMFLKWMRRASALAQTVVSAFSFLVSTLYATMVWERWEGVGGG